MLQMPPSLWPVARAAHARYWREGLAAVSIDDEVRAYLTRVIRMEYLGDRVPERLARWRAWLTTGFLPPEIRDPMHLPWTAADQRRFDRFTRRVATVVRRSPPAVQAFPLNREIRDVRRRLAAGSDCCERSSQADGWLSKIRLRWLWNDEVVSRTPVADCDLASTSTAETGTRSCTTRRRRRAPGPARRRLAMTSDGCPVL